MRRSRRLLSRSCAALCWVKRFLSVQRARRFGTFGAERHAVPGNHGEAGSCPENWQKCTQLIWKHRAAEGYSDPSLEGDMILQITQKLELTHGAGTSMLSGISC